MSGLSNLVKSTKVSTAQRAAQPSHQPVPRRHLRGHGSQAFDRDPAQLIKKRLFHH